MRSTRYVSRLGIPDAEQLPLVIPSCAFCLCILIADRNLRCNVAFASAVADKRPE